MKAIPDVVVLRQTRILFVSEYYPPHWTGIAKSTFDWATHLAKSNQVDVLTTRFDGSLAERETSDGVGIIRAPFLLKLSRSLVSPQSVLKAALIARNYDALIIASPHCNVLFFALIAKIYGLKLVIFHHGDLIMPRIGVKRRIVNAALELIFDTLTLPSMFLADSVCTYSSDYAKSSRVLQPFLHKFVSCIPPVKVLPPSGESRVHSQMTALAQTHRIVGFAGRFVEEKGFDILFRAIPLLIKRLPDVKFVFAGETSMGYENFFGMNADLVAENAEHLVFLGRLSATEMSDFYSNLFVFALPSRSDCFALTQAEAMLHGVPVVVTDIPGARVLVQHTGYGEVVAAEDPAAIASGLFKVLTQPERYAPQREMIHAFLKAGEDAYSGDAAHIGFNVVQGYS